MLEKSRLLVNKGKVVLQQFSQFLGKRLKPKVSTVGSLEVRIMLLSERLDKDALSEMNAYIQLLHYIGCQVREIPLQEQIPNEYIGLMKVFDAGKLLYQKYLKIQVGYVEKKRLDFVQSP